MELQRACSALEALAYPYPGRSTSQRPDPSAPSSKALISRVAPGVLEVRANCLRWASAFSSDDLPTLDRPTSATSATVAGIWRAWGNDDTKRNASGPAIR